MKKLIFSIQLLIFSTFLNYGQQPYSDLLKIPQVIQPSPEAAGLGKYGDIPVSNYTGTANISIPIHVVKSGKLSLPIELSYHPSGIQVSQEATWVGLGWNLIAGGAINYTPVGGSEQINYNPTMLPWEDRKNLLDYVIEGSMGQAGVGFKHEDVQYEWVTDTYGNKILMENPSLGATPIQVIMELTSNPNHGEPDVYSVNFLNYSFKFFIHPQTNLPVMIGKKNKCRIEPMGIGSGNVPVGFIITGEDGVGYWFTDNEWDHDAAGNSSIGAWYLTKILSPEGDVITFTYQKPGLIKTVPSLNERIGLNFPDDYPNQKIKRQINPGWTNNLYLASIETSNEKVLFDLENRSDMPDGARRLKTIKVFDKLLGKRIINDSLSYDYFTGTDIGGDYTTDDNYKGNAVADDLLRKRLKLTKLTRFDANAAKGEEYTFAYNESVNLPLKSSFARDYWGYYNGQENASQLIPNGAQHTLIPKLRDIVLPGSYPDIPEEFWKFSGANRGASAGNITAWMLQSIRYPTGGRTEFQFEPHAFSNQTYLSAEDRNQLYTTPVPIPSVFYNNPTASQQYKSQPFTLNARTLIHLEGTINGNISGQYLTLDQLLGTYIAIYNPTGPQAITYQLTTSDYDTFTTYHLKIWKTDFYLDAGSYVLTCGVPSTLGYQGYTDIVSASLNYENYHPEVLANAKPIGGGVRVQSITNYDENNKVVLTKNYTYKGGKMLTPLQMLENRWVHGITQTHVYTLSSDSYNPPASAYCGTNVGYDKVEITNLAGSNTNGKEIDSLRNNPGTQIFSGCNFYDYDCSNGDVLKRVYLNSASDTVKVEKMTYAASDLYNEAINFVFEDNFLYNGAAFCGFQDPCRYNIFVFPNKGLWSYLQRQETTDYVQGNKISKTTEFIYNITNYCIKEYKETNSDQKTKITHYTYPVDYSSMPYSTMAGFNITNPVIEQSEYIGSDFLQSTLTSYRNWSNAVFKPDTIRTKTKTSNYEPRIEYDKYDNKGNFLQFHKDNDVITSFVWGYNQTYPVVKAENVDHASLNSAVTLVQTDLQGFLTNSIKDLTTDAQKSAWKSFNASLRDALPPNVVVTTYTYAPLIGMTSSTDPNGFTTYYEYDTFGRLKLIRDKDNKILKQYHYHYQSQQ